MGFCRTFTKPRYAELVTGRRGQKIGSFILMLAGSLMAIPFVVPLPFNNMLPGFAILFFCIGELADDGLMVFVAFGWIVVTVIYFSLFFFGLYYLGSGVLDYFKFSH